MRVVDHDRRKLGETRAGMSRSSHTIYVVTLLFYSCDERRYNSQDYCYRCMCAEDELLLPADHHELLVVVVDALGGRCQCMIVASCPEGRMLSQHWAEATGEKRNAGNWK